MSKILFVYENNMPTVSILREEFEELVTSRKLNSTFRCLTDIVQSDIDFYDVIVFIRPLDILSAQIAWLARKAGHIVITYCDDNLLIRKPISPWRLYFHKKTLSNSHVICSPSIYLCNKYVDYTYGKRMAVVHTVVRREDIKNSNKKNEIVKIVYAAGEGHEIFFNQFVKPVLKEFFTNHSKNFSLTLVGVRPDLREFEEIIPITYVKGMNLQEYRRFMQKEKFDIGLAPLSSDEFTKCKYFNKYIEYTMSGIFGIYSNIIPYSMVVKNRITGLLTDNTYDGWLQALSIAASNPELRDSCVKTAQEELCRDYSEKKVMEDLYIQIPEMFQTNRSYHQCGSFKMERFLYYVLFLVDRIYLLLFFWKTEGIKEVLKRIQSHFDDKSAYE